MVKKRQVLSWDAHAAVAVALLALGYLLVGYLTLSPGHEWGDDWAQYVNHARNLASGRAYSDTGYIFNPNEPHVGPPSYPPGLPLVLAPIVKGYGLDIIALKSVSLLCMTGAILLTFLLYRYALGAVVAAAAACLFGLHWVVWSYRDYIISEPPYILWTLVSLFFASQRMRHRGIAQGIFCALFAYAAFLTRPIGITLIIAVILYEIAQRGPNSWRFWCVAAIPAVGITLQRHFIPLVDYSAELHVPSLAELAQNVVGYWKAIGSLFPLGGKLSLLSPLAVAGLSLLGIGYRLRMLAATSSSLMRQIPVDVWYLALYVGALVILPFETNDRYLVPILPILGAYAAYAISRVLGSTPYAQPAGLTLFGLFMCYYAAVHWAHDRMGREDNALCNDCRSMYAFVRNSTDPSARVAFAKPRAMALLANRASWVWTTNRNQPFTWDEFTNARIDYIVLVPPAHVLAPKYPAQLNWDTWRSNPKLRLAYENPSFQVLRFKD